MKMTVRQTLLLSRLIVLGEMATARILPLEVLEILGFGSFFRGKPKPKDVDLIIRYSSEPGRAFSSFATILEHVCGDVQYECDFDTPRGAFLYEYDRRHASMLPGLVSVDDERKLFSDWLEGHSWSMLFPRSVADANGWEDPTGFARRLLRRRLPNLNVVYYIFPDVTPDQLGLRAGFTESIWSRERPDTKQNIFDALAPDRVLANSRNELRGFHLQLFRIHATLQLLSPHALPRKHRLVQESRSSSGFSLLNRGMLLTEGEAKEQLGLAHEFPYADLLPADVPETVERLRGEVKELWPRVEAIRKIIRILNRHADGFRGRTISAEAFVAKELLSSGRPKQREFLRKVLAEFGYLA